MSDRLTALVQFYRILENLESLIGGKLLLEDRQWGISCPRRGVYFFFEPGEERKESGKGLRVVRVGTHAVSNGSKSTLRGRLSAHRGNLKTGGGNHRASVFRLLIGEALARRYPELALPSWGYGSSASRNIRCEEAVLEKRVSEYLRRMPFIVVAADDAPSAQSIRAYVERNSIALLSNLDHGENAAVDSPSNSWLGRLSNRSRVCRSGLWNNRHVEETFDPDFIETLEQLVRRMA